MGGLSGALSGAAAGAAFGPIGAAVGGIGGGLLGLFSGNNAAKKIAQGNINAEHGILGATGGALNEIGQGVNEFAPYLGAGKLGIEGLQGRVLNQPTFQFNPSEYFNSPAYNFQLQQGQNAILNNASTSGFGGNTLRDLTQYGQGLASTYYNQAFNQAQQTFQTNQNATLQNLQALINAGEFGASGTLAGKEALGQTALQGNQLAGNYAVGAAGGQAGGALNQGNQLSGILQGGIGLLGQIPGLFGGGASGNQNGIDPGSGLPIGLIA